MSKKTPIVVYPKVTREEQDKIMEAQMMGALRFFFALFVITATFYLFSHPEVWAQFLVK